MADPVIAQAPTADRRVAALGVVFLVVACLLMLRATWAPRVPPGQLVEVGGDVARPGLYVVEPATLAAAVEAAGGLADGVPETPLLPGDAVHVDTDGAHVVPATHPLLAARPVDVNLHEVAALQTVPGLPDVAATALVAERIARGPFRDVGELRRVSGVSRSTLDRVRPFVTTGGVASRPPVDLNVADASELEALPGIGPSLAARIVADRAAHGPFRTVRDLDRVPGVGPATVARLAGLADVGGLP